MQSRAIGATNFFISESPQGCFRQSYTLLRRANVNYFTLSLHSYVYAC